MDLQGFQQILLNTLANNPEIIQQAQNALMEIKGSNYEAFVNFELGSILHPINDKIPSISIVHLYREAKDGDLFQDSNIAMNFLTIFADNITNQLISPLLKEQFKMILSSILALLHIYIYKASQNVSIPTYILTSYTQIPQIKKYLMHCVYEIAIADPDLGGFLLDDLLKILSDDIPNPDLFIPRIHLYFALAMNKSDQAVFHAMFNVLIIQPMFEPKFSETILRSIANFADIDGYFFSVHSAELFQKLIYLSLHQEVGVRIRDYAMLCMMSIVRNAPEMCKSEAFIQMIAPPLVLIASEITDENPWEYDANDMSPCQLSLDVLNCLNESTESPIAYKIVFQIYKSVLINTPPVEGSAQFLQCFKFGTDSWQAKYAVISSLCALMNQYCEMENTFPLLTCLLPYLNSEVHPRIRFAIYKFIKGAFKLIVEINKPLISSIKIIIEAALHENELITKQYSFKALATFFNSPMVIIKNHLIYANFFVPYFQSLINELQTQPPVVSQYIAACVGNLARAVKDEYRPYFESTSDVFYQLLNDSQNIAYSVKIIHSFAICLTNAEIYTHPEFHPICCQFLQAALRAYGSEFVDEEGCEQIIESIRIFILKLGDISCQYTADVMPRALEIAAKNIDISQSEAFDGVYGLKASYKQIPSSDSSVKLYVLKQDVAEVRQSLDIIEVIIKSNIRNSQYFFQTMEIAKHWICLQYFIEDIVLSSWHALYAFFNDNSSDPSFYDFFLQCYIESNENYGSNEFLNELVKMLSVTLKRASQSNWHNPDMFIELLKCIPNLINHSIQAKKNMLEVLKSYDNYDFQDKKLNIVNDLLLNVNSLVSKCFNIHLNLTLQCLNEEIIPKVFSMMQENDYDFLIFYVDFINKLYKHVHADLDTIIQFSEYIIRTVTAITTVKNKIDCGEFLLQTLGKIFYRVDLAERRDYAEYLVNFFRSYIVDFLDNINIEDDDEQKSNNDSLSDAANVSFAKFLLTNLKNLSDKEKAVSDWDDCLPIWDVPVDSQYVYAFMIMLIQEKNILNSLDIYWVDKFMQPIISDISANEDKYGIENLKKFAELLRIEIRTPEGEMAIKNILFRPDKSEEENFIMKKNYFKLMNF